jgi:hypothetical protein
VFTSLSAGLHEVEFHLLNDKVEQETDQDRNGSIRRVVVERADNGLVCASTSGESGADILAAYPCATGQPPAVLGQGKQAVAVEATTPLAALYDIELLARVQSGAPVSVTVQVDDMPIGGMYSLGPNGFLTDERIEGPLILPPLYLANGAHKVVVRHQGGGGKRPVVVDQYGTSPLPLPVELARGAYHTLALRLLDTTPHDARIYVVQIEPYAGPFRFAASSTAWEAEHNSVLDVSGSRVRLPAQVRLSKALNIESPGLYELTLRARTTQPADGPVLLRLLVGGWISGQTEAVLDEQWSDHTLRLYIPEGRHHFQLWWEGNNLGNIDIMDVALRRVGDS